MFNVNNPTSTATQNPEILKAKIKFILIREPDVKKLLKSDLTAADFKVYLYLCDLDPFGNRFVDLPSQSQIALELGLSRKTVNQVQAKLEKLGLFEFKVSNWKGRNLTGSRAYTDPQDEVTPVTKTTHPVTKMLHPITGMLHLPSSNPCEKDTSDAVHIITDLDQSTTTPNPPPVVVDRNFDLENLLEIQEDDRKIEQDLTQQNQDLKGQNQSQNLNQQNSLNSKGIGEGKFSAAAANPEIFQKKSLLDEIAKAIAPQPVTKAIAKSVDGLTAPAIRQAIFAFHEYKANEIAKGNTINSPIALMIAALKGEHQTPWIPNKPQTPTDWNEWFNAAQNVGLVRYSQGLPNGDIQVAMSDGNLRLFSELVQEYPLEKLKSQ